MNLKAKTISGIVSVATVALLVGAAMPANASHMGNIPSSGNNFEEHLSVGFGLGDVATVCFFGDNIVSVAPISGIEVDVNDPTTGDRITGTGPHYFGPTPPVDVPSPLDCFGGATNTGTSESSGVWGAWIKDTVMDIPQVDLPAAGFARMRITDSVDYDDTCDAITITNDPNLDRACTGGTHFHSADATLAAFTFCGFGATQLGSPSSSPVDTGHATYEREVTRSVFMSGLEGFAFDCSIASGTLGAVAGPYNTVVGIVNSTPVCQGHPGGPGPVPPVTWLVCFFEFPGGQAECWDTTWASGHRGAGTATIATVGWSDMSSSPCTESDNGFVDWDTPTTGGTVVGVTSLDPVPDVYSPVTVYVY